MTLRRTTAFPGSAIGLTTLLLALWAMLVAHALPRLADGHLDPVLAPLLLQDAHLPRLAMALVAGAALGLAGWLLQTVLRNPLASPTTLGAASGAQLALLLSLWLAPAGLPAAPALAWLGAVAAMAGVLTLSWHRGLEPTAVVLAGLVINLTLGAVGSMLLMLRPEAFHGVLLWGLGTLNQPFWRDIQGLLAVTALGAISVWALHTPLHLLTVLGQDAQHRGVPVTAIRLGALGLAAVLTAGVISTVGMLGFIGLAAPAAVRALNLRTVRQRLLACMATGAVLLWAADLAVQALGWALGRDIATGALTSLLGGPLLIVLLLRRRAQPGPCTPPQTAPRQTPRQAGGRASVILWAALVVALLLALAFALTHSPAGGTAWIAPLATPWLWPRVLGAAVAGAMLAWAGVLLQRVSGNPMAGPELMGVSAGAGLGVLAVLMMAPTLYGTWALPAGLLGALAVMGLLAALNLRQGLAPERVLLTGMALAALLDSGQRLVLAGGDPRGQQVLAWMSGSTYYTTPALALAASAALAALAWPVLRLVRGLEILGLGPTMAQALGAPVSRLRWTLMGLAAGLTALATLLVGPLSFIGLLAPHLTRLLGLAQARAQLRAAPLLGAALMVLADALGRTLWSPYEIPAGLMASLAGGAFFLVLMRRL